MTEIAATQPDTAEAPAGMIAADHAIPRLRWLAVLLVPLLVLKGLQVFVAAPTADEAYYWLWGQNLSLSYYDHPPLAAWLQRLSAEIFGWNLFGLRAATLASFGGCLWILWFWSKRLSPRGDHVRLFLGGMVIWLAMPMLMRFQSLAHQDHLLVFLGLATAHFWALFHESLTAKKRTWRFYYLGCMTLGLAGLAKYNAVFIGLGFAGWVLISAKGRPLLLSPHLWGGAAIAVLMQAPVVIWNIRHGWPSITYNLESRIGESLYGDFAGNLQGLVIASIILISPVVWVAMWRFLFSTGAQPTLFQPAGRMIFLASTVTFVALCVSNTVLYYWNIAAFIFVLPVLALFFGSKTEFGIHAVYGILISTWMVVFQVIYPSYKIGGNDTRDNDISFGLQEIASIVEAEETRLGADMVMTTDYRTAALLSFTAKRLDVLKIGPRNDQFDFWINPADHKGKNALILVDDTLPERELLAAVFETVSPVRQFTIERYGFAMHSYQLVYGENYSGAGPH